MHWSSLAGSVLTAVGLVVGWVLALSLRTQARARVYEKRLEAYAGLWHALEALPVGNKDVSDLDDIDRDKRAELAGALTAWYYAEKGGLLLTEPTRRMWLTLRTDLGENGGPVHPHPQLWRQASLLRTQLKADLEVYYGGHISEDALHSSDESKFLDCTVLQPFSARGPRTRLWMRFRFAILRADDPIMRARRLWQRVQRMPYKSRNEAPCRTNDATGSAARIGDI